MAEIIYRECRRNHAATIGLYAIDGCGEFLLNQSNGNPLLCAACGCHRNFHRKELAVQSSAFCLAIRSGGAAEVEPVRRKEVVTRTIFTEEQKTRMREYAERLGWKLQNADKEELERFCSEIGIGRRVFKVWLGNNRRNLRRNNAVV